MFILTEKGRKVAKRADIEKKYKWDLEAIYSSNSDWEKDYNKVKELGNDLAMYQGKLNSASNLLQALQLYTTLTENLWRVIVYARMRKDEDNGNTTYQALADRATSLAISMSSISSYLVPEILLLTNEQIEEFMSQETQLKGYKQYLEEILRTKPHILSQELEQLLAETGELAQAPDNIYSMLNNADIKFPVIVDENGEEVELTKGRYTQFMESSNRKVREDAFEALYTTYKGLKNTLSVTLNSNVKKNMFYAKVRKYNSSLEAALFEDNISPIVYNQLIDTVHDNLDLMHRYISLRKKMLGVEELHMYDLYTPIIKDTKISITYEEAQQKVMEGLHPLGKEYRDLLQKAFNSGWIDVYENEGKTGGAYSWGTYGTNPYILLNYSDKVSDMFTLAHELGHSLHSYYSNHAQPFIYSKYKIFVAEVASTLNEALLMDYLLKTTTDKKEKLFYLNYYLEQFRGTIYRQTMFAEFEKAIHEKTEAGEALTAELLNSMYHDLNEKYYGKDIVVDELIDYEWGRIPHFYMDFYVYKYATGFSAAISLAKQILEEGEPAVERYIEFLKSGSSDYPLELLKVAGVDMNSKEPIQQALDVFKDILDEMENLLLTI